MGVISSDLVKFKNSVEPKLPILKEKCSVLGDKVKDNLTETRKFRGDISQYYSSSNIGVVLNKLDKVNDIYDKIYSSINDDLSNMLLDSGTIITLVKELEEINKKIDAQMSIISSHSSDSDDDKRIASDAQSVINSLNSEFNTKHDKVKIMFDSLKSRDSEFVFVSEFSNKGFDAEISDLEYGSFELKEFTSSEGKKIQYYIYVPNYGKEVEKLPVMLYMHGGSGQNTVRDSWMNHGLTEKISKKQITPSGIVIMPYIVNFEGDNIENTLKELTDSVVSEYNADENRISISGHSYGGITTYRMINKYPDYFSCAVPISGADGVTSAFSNMKVWSFNGSQETTPGGRTSCQYSKAAVDNINKMGGKAFMTILKTGHAGTNKITYEDKYLSPDGEMINPIDWAFKQVKL